MGINLVLRRLEHLMIAKRAMLANTDPSPAARAERAALLNAYEYVSGLAANAHLPGHDPLIGERTYQLKRVIEIVREDGNPILPKTGLTGRAVYSVQVITVDAPGACVATILDGFDLSACKFGLVVAPSLRPRFIDCSGVRTAPARMHMLMR